MLACGTRMAAASSAWVSPATASPTPTSAKLHAEQHGPANDGDGGALHRRGHVNKNLITSAAWEPYGGLRAYQINTPDGGAASVEYMLGDDGAKPPMRDAALPAAVTKCARSLRSWFGR